MQPFPYFIRAATALALASTLIAQATEVSRFEASDVDAGDNYGHSVAVSGDTAILGAPLDEASALFAGSAYIQVRDGANWVEQAKLLGSAITTSDRFGWDVDISGETAVVTAIFGDGAASVSGTAYVFVRTGSTWSETQILAPADGASSDWFGRSVCLEGNTLAIGASQDDDTGTNSGSVYIYEFNGSSWVQQAKLTASDGAESDNFGQAVSLSGDTILIGAPNDDDNLFNSGSAYVFTRSGVNWTQQAKLIASDGSPSDSFGFGVALDGDQALVGAYLANIQVFSGDAGAGYVFQRNAGIWSEVQKLTPVSLAVGDDCGFNVALDGIHALLAAPGHQADRGSAFHFIDVGGGLWVEEQELLASDGADNDAFSYDLDLSGDHALFGAFTHDGVGANSGAAYLFDLFRLDLQPAAPVAGQPLSFAVTGGSSSATTWMAVSLSGSGSTAIPSLGVVLDLLAPIPLGLPISADPDGTATWPVTVPASASGVTIWAQGMQMGRVTNARQATVL